MKQFFTLALISMSFFTTKVFSQVELTVGKPYTVVDSREKMYFYENNEMLAIKRVGKNIILQKMNSDNLTLISKKIYEDFPEGIQIEGVIQYPQYTCMFYSVWDKPNQTEQLFCRKIDFKGGVFLGIGIRIIAVNKKISISTEGKFTFKSSYDNSKLLVQYRVKPEIKNDNKNYDVIGMNMFDDNIELLWSKEVTMPYTEKKMNSLDYSLDSEGNGYMLSKVYDDNTTDAKKIDENDVNYHIELFKITANSAALSVSHVTLKDKFINAISIFNTPNNYMVCAGFYHNGKQVDAADGIFLFKLNMTGEIYDIKSHEIPLAVINDDMSESEQRKNEKREEKKDNVQIKHLILKQIIVKDDGSFVLIGEQSYLQKRYDTNSNGNTVTSYEQHNDDVVISKIDPEGNLTWMKKLSKRQQGVTRLGELSYKFMNGQDSYFILYLSQVYNEGGVLWGYKVDKINGSVSKFSILDTENINNIKVYQFSRHRILPVNDNEFIIEFYKKDKEDLLIKAKMK